MNLGINSNQCTCYVRQDSDGSICKHAGSAYLKVHFKATTGALGHVEIADLGQTGNEPNFHEKALAHKY